MTYHSLLAALLTVGALDVEYDEVALCVAADPDASGCLLAALCLVHDLEVSVEQQVQECTLARTLTANHGHHFVVGTALHQIVRLEPRTEFIAAKGR